MIRLTFLTTLAMIAFAANSVIGRLALIEGEIGAGSFALIRLASGAATLVGLVLLRSATRAPFPTARIGYPWGGWDGGAGGQGSKNGSWTGALALLTYAGFFSYAYIALPAGTGAVILFAVVQVTMIGTGIAQGERPGALQWSGLAVAFAALLWLVSPGVEAPPLIASLSMVIAGIGWGVYSLLGRGGGDPTAATAGNFARATLIALFVAPLLLFNAPEMTPSARGIGLAILSGAVTSGLGYAIWYAALKGLTATRASIAQLSVPALAAIGGVLFLNEPITLRFAVATALILSGVAIATLTPAPVRRKAD